MISTWLLDAGPLGLLCHSKAVHRAAVQAWLQQQYALGATVYLPEVADFEVRRKLLHLVERKQTSLSSLSRLNALVQLCDYLPMSTDMWRAAARLWCEARLKGIPATGDSTLNADVLLAAQALHVAGTVVTMNAKHLGRFVPVQAWPIP
jgi:predicted nucleic acid-binding protein